MRYVISSETRVKGPQKFTKKLPIPKKPFQDISVIAFPAPKNDDNRIPDPMITSNPQAAPLENLFDGDIETDCPFPKNTATNETPWIIDIQTKNPYTARSITLHPGEGNFSVMCELQAIDKNGRAKTIKKFALDRRGLRRPQYSVHVGFMIKGAVVISFPKVTSAHFRLIVSDRSGDFQCCWCRWTG